MMSPQVYQSKFKIIVSYLPENMGETEKKNGIRSDAALPVPEFDLNLSI